MCDILKDSKKNTSIMGEKGEQCKEANEKYNMKIVFFQFLQSRIYRLDTPE